MAGETLLAFLLVKEHTPLARSEAGSEAPGVAHAATRARTAAAHSGSQYSSSM